MNSSLVRNSKQLKDEIHRVLTEYQQPALVEKFLPGREFTVALLGNGPEAQVLPIVEIQFEELPGSYQPHLLLRGQMDLGHGGKTPGNLLLPGKAIGRR